MSFKSRLIDYCENTAKMDCPQCAFREPCGNVNTFNIPSEWYDYNFDDMRSKTWDYMKVTSKKMSEIARLMADASEDDLAEIARGGQHGRED